MRPLQLPGTRPESILAMRQGAHRAHLREVALELGGELLIVERRHQCLDATLLQHDLLLAGDLVVVADTAPAEDAALLVELDVLRKGYRLVEVHLLGDGKARRTRAVAEGEVLQVALAPAIAH